MIDTAIILCGGFGTRLKSVVNDVPKPMAEINDIPFLQYQLDFLEAYKIKNVILATSYKANAIKEHFQTKYKNVSIHYTEEPSPLGTGGGIQLAMQFLEKQDFATDATLILNGDSFIHMDLDLLRKYHLSKNSIMTIGLKPMQNFDRYGNVSFNEDLKITSFHEKEQVKLGYINTGVYIVDQKIQHYFPPQEKFSFEQMLSSETNNINPNAFLTSGYFIDIGIPQDYQKAQSDFKNIHFENKKNSNQFLFLDRDGVVNQRRIGDYIRKPDQFHFLPGVKEALPILRNNFKRIFVVTNQQGIGKELMSIHDLDAVHQHMQSEMTDCQFDGIYYAPDLAAPENYLRKPNPGMAVVAQSEFPEVIFSECTMVGDSISDIQFGNNLGMKTILILGKEETPAKGFDSLPDHQFDSLYDFAKSISES